VDVPARHAVLMGDPAYFSIRGGANPHTRDRWGWRKQTNRTIAIEQWHGLARALEARGVAVYVIPPKGECPGLVYPANAGVLYPMAEGLPTAARRFYLSNLLPSRAAEQPVYADFIERLGLRTARLMARFEGEADFFPTDGRYLFTYGRLERQRFVLRFGIPPYRRIYGFRSEIAALGELAAVASDVEIMPLELVDEAHYHGDTVLCSFGPQRQFLLAHLAGLAPWASALLGELFGDAMISLQHADAARYAANSFAYTGGDRSYLFMPAGVSEQLQAQVRERGVEPVLVDVSEFLRKGGGSVKCMIGDLGPWDDATAADPTTQAFRSARRYATLVTT
jgi:N-dimethylarginine dimethylaminohydrolase